jgi:hypothetical protein
MQDNSQHFNNSVEVIELNKGGQDIAVSESVASFEELVEPGPLAKPTKKRKRSNLHNKLVEKAQEIENSRDET